MITTRDFVKRCTALGTDNPHAAARRLGLGYITVYRAWKGQRPVSARIAEYLERVEREQPVKPLTPLMVRVLMETEPFPGMIVEAPSPRSNFERSLEWWRVMDALRRAELVEEASDDLGQGYDILTPLGARTAAWLRERDG